MHDERHVELVRLYETYDNDRLDSILKGVGGGDLHGCSAEVNELRLAAAAAAPSDAVEYIVANVTGYGFFTWDGSARGAAGLLTAGTADCRSLVEGCCAVINALGIKADHCWRDEWFYVDSTEVRPLIDGKTGNVDGERWCFENHHWLYCNGREYDLLFGGGPLDFAAWRRYVSQGVEDGYTWTEYEGGIRIYVTDGSQGYPYTRWKEQAMVFDPDGHRHRHDRSCAESCTLL
ncbi:hypothetical protein SSP24_81550 [Streptomyces spinoverrucosus]|uniref:Uncharacterized protein n=1 Tax=Streptomyces spinoverrucosus TaxID=284043 RepID=A0A4Y3VXV8_9ACTN|nr:hypothetical protein [Streptomyces spinoverrucosus]GEC10500.1 hypothetical protein SSP24_81550 [Streptomyces spinoverrucosus]GHB96252.1 hypothetical protein GCM10010397_81090 [Streptomyces spinoverrucosus]